MVAILPWHFLYHFLSRVAITGLLNPVQTTIRPAAAVPPVGSKWPRKTQNFETKFTKNPLTDISQPSLHYLCWKIFSRAKIECPVDKGQVAVYMDAKKKILWHENW